MKKLRRFTLALFMFSFSFLPVFAQDTNQSELTNVYQSQLTPSEIDALLIKQTEEYLKKIIPDYDANSKGRARPSYETVYGPTKAVVANGVAGNQLPGGQRFSTGGGFYFSRTGGPNISVSVAFANPYGPFSVSLGLGNNAISGMFIVAPNTTQYFKLYGKNTYNVRPFIVYYNDGYGHKSVYHKNVSSYLFRADAYAKAV